MSRSWTTPRRCFSSASFSLMKGVSGQRACQGSGDGTVASPPARGRQYSEEARARLRRKLRVVMVSKVFTFKVLRRMSSSGFLTIGGGASYRPRMGSGREARWPMTMRPPAAPACRTRTCSSRSSGRSHRGSAARSSPGTHKRAPAGYSDVCPLTRYESFHRRAPATLPVAHGARRPGLVFVSAPACIGRGRGGS